MSSRPDIVQTVGLFVLAALVIGFVGAFALLYHDTPDGTLALGALLPLAGMIGAHFYQSAQQGFLGALLSGQRQDLLGGPQTTPSGTSGSATSGSSPKPSASSVAVSASPTTVSDQATLTPPVAVVEKPWSPPAAGGGA